MKREDIIRQQEEGIMRELAEKDWLTGLFNRETAENKIEQAMEALEASTLFVIDIDRFKYMNDQCGHLIGDQILKETGEVLAGMFYGESLAGRTGGDEFVAFIPEDSDWQMVENRMAELSYSLLRVGKRMNLPENLTVTVGVSCGRGTFQELFEKANTMLMEEKKKKRNSYESRKESRHDGQDEMDTDSMDKDMELISNELRESGTVKGACCYNYEVFKQIFRFVERGLKRSSQKAYVVLLSLTDGCGEVPPLARRNEKMQELETVISGSLRTGDVFTRYSSSQYLMMILDVSEENALMIGERICKRYYEKMPEGTDLRLCRQLYPMKAAGNKAEWG